MIGRWAPLALVGPAFAVRIGYVKFGNWATDLAAGAYGYRLLWVVLASNAIAIVLQLAVAQYTLQSGAELGVAITRRWPRLRTMFWTSFKVQRSRPTLPSLPVSPRDQRTRHARTFLAREPGYLWGGHCDSVAISTLGSPTRLPSYASRSSIIGASRRPIPSSILTRKSAGERARFASSHDANPPASRDDDSYRTERRMDRQTTVHVARNPRARS